jgi:hypothetical protein
MLYDGGERVWLTLAGIAFVGGIVATNRLKDLTAILAGIVVALGLIALSAASANTHYWASAARSQLVEQGFYVWLVNVNAREVGVTADDCSIKVELHTADGDYYPMFVDFRGKSGETRHLTPNKLARLCDK